MNLQVGDVLLTYPNIKWHDWLKRPWYALKMWIVYRAIHKHQKIDYQYYKAVHCGVVVNQREWFEVTFPRATYTPLAHLRGHKVTVCRPIEGIPNPIELLAKCEELWGMNYDVWELVDFAAAKLLNSKSQKRLNLFDIEKEVVCSTGAALVLEAGGVELHKNPENIRPAYYENRPNLFEVERIDNLVI